MRKWQIFASIFMLVALSSNATAGDNEDILAKLTDLYPAWNTGDVDALPFVYDTAFHVEGGLLEKNDPEESKAWVKSRIANGL